VAGFWKEIWEEDLRSPTRDLIVLLTFVAGAFVPDTVAHLALDHSFLPAWVREPVYEVFDALVLISLAVVAGSIAVRMYRGLKRLFTKQ
jgi:hypothetical protein